MAIITGTDNGDFIDQNDGVTDQEDEIIAMGGNDSAFGLGGADDIYGGSGNDNLFGGLDEDDLYGGLGRDVLDGNYGDDTLNGGADGDTFYGGDGLDAASYENSAAGVTVNLATGTGSGGDAEGDTLYSIEGLKGSGQADTLIGNDLDNSLIGNGGADNLQGGLGGDTYFVAQASSTIVEAPNAGDDTVFALFEVSGSIKVPDNVETLALLADDQAQVNAVGTAADDSIQGINGKFRLSGLGGDDTLLGGENKDWLSGGPGADKLDGGEGNDQLLGFSGNDFIKGSAGKDVLTGGLDKDTLTGGADRDVFDFNSVQESRAGATRDFINDFHRGNNVVGDDIDLRGIDAKTGVAGNQAFHFIGTDSFHHEKGELHYKDLGASCLVQGDVNGDGKADFDILVKAAALSSGDFLL